MGEVTRRAVLAGLAGTALGGADTAAAEVTTTSRQRATTESQHSAAEVTDVEAVVDDAMAPHIGETVAGATVAVVRGDDVALTKGYGSADIDSGTPMRADETAVRVGSVAKLVTWTAVLQGVEDGVLELDADVNRYLTDSTLTIPDTYDEPVTLRALGTHTAGFDLVPNPGFVETADRLTDLETALAETQPERIRPPGEAVGYSNWGAALAGHIVAEAYDTTFQDHVQSNVFAPLGMDRSTFEQPVSDGYADNLAAPHEAGESLRRADRPYINFGPAGSLSTTGPDMATFMCAHLGYGPADELLGDEALTTMHSEHYSRHPAVTGWRYGFYEHGNPAGNYIGHGGATVYYTSWLGLLPEHDVGIFVGFNSRGPTNPGEIADEVVAAYDLQPAMGDVDPTTGPKSQERANTVAGEYESVANSPQSGHLQLLGVLNRLSVEADGDGTIVTTSISAEPTEWVEVRPYVYRERGGDNILAADVADGHVTALHLNSAPQTTFEPVATHEQQTVVLGSLGAPVAGFGLSLTGWAGHRTWRWIQRYRTGTPDQEGASVGATGDEPPEEDAT